MKTITVTGFFGVSQEIQVEDDDPRVTVDEREPGGSMAKDPPKVGEED